MATVSQIESSISRVLTILSRWETKVDSYPNIIAQKEAEYNNNRANYESIIKQATAAGDTTTANEYRNKLNALISGIADAKGALADAQRQVASLKEEIASLERELAEAKKAEQAPPAPTPPPPAPAPTSSANASPTTTAAPITSAGTPTKAPLTGAASDDSGASQSNPAGSTGGPPAAIASAEDQIANSTPLNTVDTTTPGAPGGVPTTPALRTEASATQPPGKRLKNPLGYLSSYTYQLSLYMITPDAYDAFIASGRRKVDALNRATVGKNGGGAFLVAQSGGINNEQEDRAPGFAFDYAIDNLSFRNSTSGRDNQSATNTTEIKFNITEPYGFSFINNLKRAQDALKDYSGERVLLPGNPSKQFFILGIRFFGYDESGRIMKGNEVFDGTTLDPNASGNGALFERYYDIVITKLKFKIDGNAVVYSIEASSTPPKATMTSTRGVVQDKVVLNAATVSEAFAQLTTALNDRQTNLAANDANNPSLYNTYSIEFVGDAAGVIGNAKLVSPADLDKFKWPGSGATNQSESNDRTATRSNTPNNTTRELTIDSGSMIPAAINTIITQSQFLEEGLRTVYTTSLEPPMNKSSMPEIDRNTRKVLKWYNCSSQISNARWNSSIRDWVYDIKYIIQTYETPVLDSVYKNLTTRYYGPHKRYEYWYTGKNSEIISYVQELNNMYFTVALSPPNEAGEVTLTDSRPETNNENTEATPGNANDGAAPVALAQPSEITNGNRIGQAATATTDSVLTSLYDPSSQAEAKITIMGDPDFIMYDSSAVVTTGNTQQTQTLTESQVYNRFYGSDGYTVNPNGGQVFIEIDFKEAVDYSSDGVNNGPITGEPGTLSINESILFWEYPDDIAKLVKGVSYMVRAVTSTFSGGSFKQTLECMINTFSGRSAPGSTAGGREQSNANNAGTTPPVTGGVSTGATPNKSNSTLADSGLRPDSRTPVAIANLDNAPIALNSVNTSQLLAEISVPTITGSVVDDDASSIVVTARPNSITSMADRLDAQQREILPAFNVGDPNAIQVFTGPSLNRTANSVPTISFPTDFPLT